MYAFLVYEQNFQSNIFAYKQNIYANTTVATTIH